MVPAAGGRRRSHPVYGLAVGDGHHPPEGTAALRVEPGRHAPDLEEGLLGDLFGLGRVPKDPDHEPVEPWGDGVVELRERALVAPRRLSEQTGQAGVRVHALRRLIAGGHCPKLSHDWHSAVSLAVVPIPYYCPSTESLSLYRRSGHQDRVDDVHRRVGRGDVAAEDVGVLLADGELLTGALDGQRG